MTVLQDRYEQERQAQEAMVTRRPEIVSLIQKLLHPAELADLYETQITSSVSTGCYDVSYARGNYERIEQYVETLKAHWRSQQGNYDQIVVKVQYVLAFGSDTEKAQLKALLQLPE